VSDLDKLDPLKRPTRSALQRADHVVDRNRGSSLSRSHHPEVLGVSDLDKLDPLNCSIRLSARRARRYSAPTT